MRLSPLNSVRTIDIEILGIYLEKGVKHSIESVKTNAPNDARYERKESTNGQPYFVLKAANGEPLGRSETYSSKSAMENGIESVKKNAPGAITEDLS